MPMSEEQKVVMVRTLEPDLRLVVVRDGDMTHYYNSKCTCTHCISVWSDYANGRLVVMSPDGKRKMRMPVVPAYD